VSEVFDIAVPAYADYVLDDLWRWRNEGLKTALLTLVAIDGASPRPLGSQMAVAEDGRAVGAITGGCAEQALVRDALSAIARGRNHLERYGEGSRFRDIVLPCGSGITVSFDVTLSDAALAGVRTARQQRREAVYVWDGGFERLYRPQPRVLIVGQGPIVPVLAQMAGLGEFATAVVSPDDTTRQRSRAEVIRPLSAASGSALTGLIDAATAVISLFHDHDYESEILATALRSEVFYIGALGSRRTHARRIETFKALGFDAPQINRIRGPVGLDIGAKTPPEIAVSILADVIRAWRG
jgi:xanthine dehydrogenase accessory factor